MCLACLFDLFCPLRESALCLFGWEEGLLIGVGGWGVVAFCFGFGLVLLCVVFVWLGFFCFVLFCFFNNSSESFADSNYDY